MFVVANDASRFLDLGVPVHADVLPGTGTLGGLYTALVNSPADRVIVVACDMPFLDAAVLTRLAGLAAEADGAWVRTARGVEPLLACYRQQAGAAIRRELDAGRLRAADLDQVLNLAVLEERELAQFGPVDRLLLNVNSPEEYDRAR